MRIKLSNLIIVSLFSLTVVFSAISNLSAGLNGGGAMDGNTTGGGSTAEVPINPHPGYSSCKAQYKGRYSECKDKIREESCQRKARSDYYFCLCLKDDMDACMKWVKLGEVVYMIEEPLDPSIFDSNKLKYDPVMDSGGTGSVYEEPTTSTSYPSPIIDSGGTSGGGSVYVEPKTSTSYPSPIINRGGSGTAIEQPATKPTRKRTTIRRVRTRGVSGK